MGLSTNLKNVINSGFGDDQGPWRQYVLDHLDYITKRTKPSNIDKLVMNQFRYDLDRFLKDRMDRRNNIGWIVLLLNNLGNDFEFSEPGIYIIPEDDLIARLYLSFTTITKNAF